MTLSMVKPRAGKKRKDNLAEVKPRKHTKKPRSLCPSGSKPEVLEVQQEKPHILGNKRTVSWGSMFEVFGDQEKSASSPHLAPKSVDHEEVVVDQYMQKKLTGTRNKKNRPFLANFFYFQLYL